jgi:hypothetical protein
VKKWHHGLWCKKVTCAAAGFFQLPDFRTVSEERTRKHRGLCSPCVDIPSWLNERPGQAREYYKCESWTDGGGRWRQTRACVRSPRITAVGTTPGGGEGIANIGRKSPSKSQITQISTCLLHLHQIKQSTTRRQTTRLSGTDYSADAAAAPKSQGRRHNSHHHPPSQETSSDCSRIKAAGSVLGLFREEPETVSLL